MNMSRESIESQKLLLEAYKFGAGNGRRLRTERKPPKEKVGKKRKSTDGDAVDEGGEEKPAKKKRTGVGSKPKLLSPALAEFLGVTSLPRPDVVSRLHVYIKEHKLQDPKNGKKILLDDKLQLVFKRKTTDYFKMNALLSKHLFEAHEA